MLARIGTITDAPVILVVGHGWDQQIGRAFELGAFDYIAKPFTSTELLARVDVALRRRSVASRKEPSGPYRYGDLVIDYVEREVTVSGRPVHLTATQYKLLVELSVAGGRVLTHERLLRLVWGPLHTGDSRVVRTCVKELRHKLGDDAARPKLGDDAARPKLGDDAARPKLGDDAARPKLGDDAARPTYIFTESGVGYRMTKPSMG